MLVFPAGLTRPDRRATCQRTRVCRAAAGMSSESGKDFSPRRGARDQGPGTRALKLLRPNGFDRGRVLAGDRALQKLARGFAHAPRRRAEPRWQNMVPIGRAAALFGGGGKIPADQRRIAPLGLSQRSTAAPPPSYLKSLASGLKPSSKKRAEPALGQWFGERPSRAPRLGQTGQRTGNPLSNPAYFHAQVSITIDRSIPRSRGAGRSRTDDGGFAIRCLSLLATAPNER